MPVVETTPYVSYIQDSQSKNHPIAAPYLLVNGTTVPADQISGGIKYEIFETLPTASSSYVGTIGLIQDSKDVEEGSYIEYLCVDKGASSSPRYAWENIGSTKIKFTGATAASSTTGISVSYDKAKSSTETAGGATVNGSNFSFNGTAATITVPAHTHSIGAATTKYFKKVDVPATFSSADVVAGLTTTTVVSAGASTTVVTGYASPSTTSVLTGITSTETRYKTQSITPTNGTETVAKAGSATTVATGLSGDTTFVKSVGAISTTYLTKSNIYPAADVTAIRKSDVTVGTPVSLTTSLGSSTMISAASAGTTNVFSTASVSNDGVLSFGTATVNTNFSATSKNITDTNIVPSVSVGNGVSVRGTSVPYLTGATTSTASGNVLVAYGKATDTNGTVTAATTSIVPTNGTATVAKAGTAVTVITSGTTTTGGVPVSSGVASNGTTNAITALGTASTVSVAKAGSNVTVVTGASGMTSVLAGVSTTASVLDSTPTTTSTGNVKYVEGIPTVTGEKASVGIAYTPAGTIGGSQSIGAHSHTITYTSTSATVTDNGHTHSVSLE